MSAVPAAALFCALGATALLAHRTSTVAVILVLLLAVCLRAPRRRLKLYLWGVAVSAGTVLVVTPFVESVGYHVLWTGPTVPVLGTPDVTREEIHAAITQSLRLAALMLAFTAYALLLDHDRIASGAGWLRRSSLAVALALRLVPTLERDALGLVEALRGRGIETAGARGYARLVSPLIGGSLERGLNLAEAMEARGYGRPGRTRAPRPPWGRLDRLGLAFSVVLVVAGVLWL